MMDYAFFILAATALLAAWWIWSRSNKGESKHLVLVALAIMAIVMHLVQK